jgi:hypothetical protein
MVTRWKPIVQTVGVSLALGLLLLFLGGYLAEAAPPQKATQKAKPEAAPTAVRIDVTEVIGAADVLVPPPTDSTAGSMEGIHMRGQWTIEVRDPDGTLVDRREFDNAVTDAGIANLVAVLARSQTVGGWRVLTTGSTDVAPGCLDDAGSSAPCVIVESTDNETTNNMFPTLTVVSSADGVFMRLAGSFVAQTNGEVAVVQTIQLFCPPTIDPDACPGNQGPTLVIATITSTDLASPIAVLTGQQVQLNVDITFN